MIRIVYGKSFLKFVKKLPVKQQEKLTDLLEIITQNPFHSLLHTKPLSGELIGFYSFRITRDWRVIFQFIEEDEIKLIIMAIVKIFIKKLGKSN